MGVNGPEMLSLRQRAGAAILASLAEAENGNFCPNAMQDFEDAVQEFGGFDRIPGDDLRKCWEFADNTFFSLHHGEAPMEGVPNEQVMLALRGAAEQLVEDQIVTSPIVLGQVRATASYEPREWGCVTWLLILFVGGLVNSCVGHLTSGGKQ